MSIQVSQSILAWCFNKIHDFRGVGSVEFYAYGEFKLYSGWIHETKIDEFKKKADEFAKELISKLKEYDYKITYHDLDADDFGTYEEPYEVEKWFAEIEIYEKEK